MKRLICLFVLCLFLALPCVLFAQTIDYNNWTFNTGTWSIINSGTTVRQAANIQNPSFFMSDFDAQNAVLEGTIRVNTTSDDDFVGLAFGLQDVNHAYVLDWKQTTQDAFGSNAKIGMAVNRVVGDYTTTTAWGHLENWQEIARNAEPWADNTTYTYRIVFTEGAFQIYINNALKFDIEDSAYTTGKFAFYNFSQEETLYTLDLFNHLPQAVLEGPSSGTAGCPVTFSAVNSTDPDGDALTFSWDFGDGSDVVSGDTVEHVYETTGVYNVTLIANDGNVDSLAATQGITIEDSSCPACPPTSASVASAKASGIRQSISFAFLACFGGPMSFLWILRTSKK